MAEIAVASNEQSQGIGQVTTAVSQMDRITQCNAASAEETSVASQDLNAQAGVLGEAVRSLQELVGANGSNTVRHVAEPVEGVRPTRVNAAPLARNKTISTRPVTITASGQNSHAGTDEQADDKFFKNA